MKPGGMEEHQRQFLLKDYEGYLASLRADVDKDGASSPETARFIANIEALFTWLRGGDRPTADVRQFLEFELDGFDEEHNYDEITYKHDAIAAAIEALR